MFTDDSKLRVKIGICSLHYHHSNPFLFAGFFQQSLFLVQFFFIILVIVQGWHMFYSYTNIKLGDLYKQVVFAQKRVKTNQKYPTYYNTIPLNPDARKSSMVKSVLQTPSLVITKDKHPIVCFGQVAIRHTILPLAGIYFRRSNPVFTCGKWKSNYISAGSCTGHTWL